LLFFVFLLSDLFKNYQQLVRFEGEILATTLKKSLESYPDAYQLLVDRTRIESECGTILDHNPNVIFCHVTDKNGLNLYNRFATALLADNTQLSFSQDNGVHVLKPGPFGNYTEIVLPFQLAGGEAGGIIRLGLKSSFGSDFIWPVMFKFVIGLILFSPLFIAGTFFLLRRCARPAVSADSPATPGLPGTSRDADSIPIDKTVASISSNFDEGGDDAVYELEMANRLLQDSYEALEVISRELGQSRDMYQALLDQAADPLLVGDRNDNIVFGNRKAQQLLGIGQQELVTRNLFATLEQLATDENWSEEIYCNLRETGRHVANVLLRLPQSQPPTQGILEAHKVVGRAGQTWTLVTIHLPVDVW